MCRTCFSTVPSAEPELAGDARVRATLGHQRQHLALARREIRERVIAPPSLDQCLHEPWIDDGSACRDPLQRVDEFVHVQNATLEQVSDPIARRKELCRLLDLDMCREHEDARLRKLVADRLCRYEPFRRVGGRHPNVDDDELGLVLAHELEELVRVAGLADHPKTRPLEHARDALTEKDVVVGHHDTTRVVRGRIDRPSTLRGPACRPHTRCPPVRRDTFANGVIGPVAG
jgi:hypothetical protein